MFEYVKWITVGVIGYAMLSMVSPAYSEEVKSNPVDQIKSAININEPNNAVTVFIKNEWEDIKTFQRHSRVKSKGQLERNREQIRNLPANLQNSIKQSAMGIGEFVQAITGVGKNKNQQ